MVQRVAKSHFQLRELLEIVAHDVLVRHADAAMQLHGLLAHKAHRLAQLHLGAGHGGAALRGGGAELEAGVVAHRAGQLELHLHVGHAVAQGLEAGDEHAELLALVHVFDRDGHGLVHHAHGFGAGGGNAGVHGQLQRGQAVGGDERGGGVDELHFSGAAAVLGDVATRDHASCRTFHQEEGDLAVQLRRNDERVGLVTSGNYAFNSCYRIP